MRALRQIPRPDPVTIAQVPHVFDGEVLLTTISGAAALMGVTNAAVRYWIRKHWVQTRLAPSGRKWIVITSLWREAPPRDVQAWVERAQESARAMTADRVAAAGVEQGETPEGVE